MTENFISEQQVDQLLAVFETKQNELKTAGIGKNENYTKAESIRNDKIVWLENDEPVLKEIFFEPISELISVLNRHFLGINDHEFHFAKYEPGAFYKRHKDAFSNDDARKISVVLYLNKNWKEGDGGELNIYNEQTTTVKPKAGTLVVFESHLEHEVLQSNTNRLSITGWLKRKKQLF